MGPQEWAKCLDALADVFGRSCHLVARPGAPSAEMSISDRAAETWFGLLQDLPDGVCLRAVAQVCRSTRAFPSVADIRSAAELLLTPSDDGIPGSEEAFALAYRWAMDTLHGPTLRGGVEHYPQEPHPAVVAAARRFGIASLRETTTAQEPTVRAQFRRTYEDVASQERARQAAHLPSLLPAPSAPAPLLVAGTQEARPEKSEGNLQAFADFAATARQRLAAAKDATPAKRTRPELRVLQGVEPGVEDAGREAARQRLASRREGKGC